MGTALLVEKAAAQSGFTAWGVIPVEQLRYDSETRRICEGNTCRGYGASWACPPAVGTLEECRRRVEQFGAMLLFSKVYSLEDSFDYEGMGEGLRDFKETVDRFHRTLEPVMNRFLILSNEGCGRCDTCTWPDAPCRFPHLLHHSLEGYGFVVAELTGAAGIKYNNGPNTVTFFGALLFNI